VFTLRLVKPFASQTVTDAHGVGADWRRGSQTVTDAHDVRAILAQGDTRHSYTNW